MGRPALRDRVVEDFRRRLCDVATRRFAEQGVAGVSLRGLADELGCSRGTPYRYFRNKDEIFAVVRARAFAQLARACEQSAAREAGAEGRLIEIGRAYLRFAREHPHAYRVAFELGQPDAEVYPELLAARGRAWGAFRNSVQYACAEGVLDGDPETVSHLYWAGLHGLAALELAGQLRTRSFEALEAPMIEALLRGTRPSVQLGVHPDPPHAKHSTETKR
ncbi:MAG: TetR/AcrR family transcriptional regulator [bacterium]|nr:TetR/AcrR family transcriptional regulator [bacterium]